MSNIFSETEVLKLPRSYQKMNYTLSSSMDYGKLYPMFWFDCVPGDSIKIFNNTSVRVKQLVCPNLTPNKFTMHFFFVPYRLLDENFTQGVMGVTEKGEEVNYEFPKWEIDADATKSKTLWDYFSLPINVKVNASGFLEEDKTNVAGVEPTRYLKRAYNHIFNTMYRNENLVDEVDLDSTDLQYRCWRADYYTKALPFQQKPTESSFFALPVNTNINQEKIPFTFNVGGSKNFTSNTLTVTPGGNTAYLLGADTSTPNMARASSINNNNAKIGTPNQTGGNAIETGTNLNIELLTKNVSFTSASFTIADERLAFQMQKWAERNARCGTRYDEFILGHFGIKPKDARLQLPEFIGGYKFPILCGENYSTVETTDYPQGTRAGIGNGMGGDKTPTYFCEEYGIILGIASILPQAEYQQGMPRQAIKHDQLDFYHHELCCLSEREVYQGELVCSNEEAGTGEGELTEEQIIKLNRTNFGFEGMYNEYRFIPNQITGEMRLGHYACWHQSRIFDGGHTTQDGVIVPKTNLSQEFVEARNVQKRPFAALDGQDPFIIDMGFSIKAFRPMTYRAEPGLIDHF